ncbi:MAG: pyrroloquinoline-quinone synthase [Candidatus Endobugula sp.]|jgi:pyrroloquinoline-quinone synthase
MNNLLSTVDFREKLEKTLHHNLTLDHPIIGELVKPELNVELMRVMALQGYQLTKNFLEYVETLFFYCPLPKHKSRLLLNLFEEETGRLSKTKNHVELMQDFIRALGISDEERDAATAYPETQELIDYRMNAVKNRTIYHVGAAAVMIASEGQNLETRAGEARHEILGKLYGLTEKDLLFFSVHQKEDVMHVSEGLNLVSDICDTIKLQDDALFAVNHTCQLFWDMYSGVAMRHCPQIMAA